MMTDAEQKLSDWLRDRAPEPPHEITAHQIVEQANRDTLGSGSRRQRIGTPILAAAAVIAVVLGVLAVLASGRDNHRTDPAASHTPVRSSSQPGPTPTPGSGGTAAPPADFAAIRLTGAHGRYAWTLTDTLSVSSDGARSWSHVPLPPQLTTATLRRINDTIAAIDIGADGTILMTVTHPRSIDLFRRSPATHRWTHSVLVPGQPPGGQVAPDGPGVLAMYTDGSVVALVAGWGTTPVHEYSDLFLSRDGGATFTRRTTGIDWGISSMLFLNAEQGFVVAGPADNMVYRTADGGRSWQLVLGSSANVDVSYGTPTRTAAGVVVPRATAAGAGITVSLEVTRDAGASFAALAPLPLRIKHFDTLSADLPVTVHGSDVWVASANRIFQTSDSGRTWRTVASAQPVTGIELSTATQAVGLASSECASNTDNCFSTTYLVTTDDGGRTWHPARR